jgi:hypothetical protein
MKILIIIPFRAKERREKERHKSTRDLLLLKKTKSSICCDTFHSIKEVMQEHFYVLGVYLFVLHSRAHALLFFKSEGCRLSLRTAT